MDLLDFFRGRWSWAKLLRLVGRLPEGSQYWAARLDDDELAEAFLAREDKHADKDGRPEGLRFEEMSSTNQLLASVVDGLSLVSAQLDALMGHEGKATPYPRRVAAVERARERAEIAKDDWIARAVEAGQSRGA